MDKKTSNPNLLTTGKKYLPFVLLFLILLVSAYLRLWRIEDYMTFLGDEGRDVLVVKRMIVDHKFTLLGPTASVGGFFLGPIYYYFMIPFLWVFNLSPVGPAVMVALFGIVTVFLVYYLGSKLFNYRVGLFSSALYALSPVIVNYSHSSWNPNIVPFFACLLIIFLYNFTQEEKKLNLFLVGCVLGIGLQLHYLFLFLAIFCVVFLFLITRKEMVKNLLLIFVGFMICFSPFILFELRHGFTNTQMIAKFIFASNDTGFNFGNFVFNIKDVIYRLFYRLVAENNLYLTIGSALIALYGFKDLKKQITKIPYVLMILWLLIPVFLFGLYKKPIYDYYFGIIFPVPFILTGIGLNALIKKRILIPIALIFFLSLIFINWQARPFIYQPNKQLAQVRNASLLVLAKALNKPFNFALITDHNSDHAYRYFFEINQNKAVVVENNVVDPERKTATGQLFVICEVSDCKPLGNPAWDVAGFGRAEIVDKWMSSVLEVYKLVPYKGVM